MFSGDTLLLTREGYRRLDHINDTVEIISEASNDGVWTQSFQTARVIPRYIDRAVKLVTYSGRPLTGSRGLMYLLSDMTPLRREEWTHKILSHRGVWTHWELVSNENKKIVMSSSSAVETLEITPEDWAFYAYAFKNNDDPETAFPLPRPAQTLEEMRKPQKIIERRQLWPEWYWECTFSEKAMFLRGLYDAHGRITKERIYFTSPTNTFSQNLVIALSEFGVRASRYIAEQVMWRNRPFEYVVDIRNAESIGRMVKSFYWSEPSLPSIRVSEVQRHMNRFYYKPTGPRNTLIREIKNVPNQMMYRLEVNESHNAILNGLVVRDSTGAYD